MTAGDFVRAVKSDAAEPDAAFIAEGVAMARAASWESIVSSMNNLLLSSLSGQVEIPSMRGERTAVRSLERSVGELVPKIGVAASSRAAA